jgi:anti-anti-sigma factor
LRGDLVHESSTTALLAQMGRECEADAVRAISIDLGEVDWIDFEGVGTLLHIARECRRHGKRLALVGAHDEVRTRLVQTGVLQYLEAHG